MRKERNVLYMACYKISRCFLNQVNQLCILKVLQIQVKRQHTKKSCIHMIVELISLIPIWTDDVIIYIRFHMWCYLLHSNKRFLININLFISHTYLYLRMTFQPSIKTYNTIKKNTPGNHESHVKNNKKNKG